MNYFIIGFSTENNFFRPNPSFMSRSYSRVRWTDEENEKLINHVTKNGPKKWKQIAIELKTKTAQQCRDHYNDVLDPDIKNALWTEEEEKILLLKYEQFGPHWAQIKTFLPGRTTGMIKNYMNLLLKKGTFQKEKKINIEAEISDLFETKPLDIEKETKEFSYFNVESLLNRPSNFHLNVNSVK